MAEGRRGAVRVSVAAVSRGPWCLRQLAHLLGEGGTLAADKVPASLCLEPGWFEGWAGETARL